MGVLEVEVVVRSIEIGQDRRAGVEAVLAPVGVRKDEQHLLRQAVGRVRLFRISVPEIVLGERDRSELRVGANRAGGNELADAGLARLLEDVRPHDEVVVGERCRIAAVEADAADARRQVDDHLGSLDRLSGGAGIAQVMVA